MCKVTDIAKKAFILAAGFGTRMRPITDRIPKPMVEIMGRSLIYRTLDQLVKVGIGDVMVNMHYMPNILQAHLEAYPKDNMTIHLSHEPELLDTGGGVRKVLDFFEDSPFYVIAGDNMFIDPQDQMGALKLLAQHWDDGYMDILTLMRPLAHMHYTQGIGDYDLLGDGRARRSDNKTGQMMWTNIRLNHPRIYRAYPEGAFSFLSLLDECEAAGRLFALEYQGDWHHLSTPEDVATLESAIRSGKIRG